MEFFENSPFAGMERRVKCLLDSYFKKHPANLHSCSVAKCIDHGRMLNNKTRTASISPLIAYSKVAATCDLGAVKARYLKSISRRMIGIYAVLLVYVDFVTDAEQNEVS